MKGFIFILLWGSLPVLHVGAQVKNAAIAPAGDVGIGWAKNSVNTVSFRRNALVTDGNEQFIAFYDTAGRVVVGRRKLSSKQWQLQTTQFTGNAADAHNCICIMADGDGFIHIAWDHHNNPLHYAISKTPHGLDFETRAMTGQQEKKLTYPEFYRLPGGDLIFLYRDGGSGNGNLVMNRYSTRNKTWVQVQNNLVDGEGQRNAYCQTAVDVLGTIHISWVWRETPDVATNHDMCYARSADGGITWQRSNGEKYQLPITAATAEYIYHIPQHSDLMNQTAMYADEKGHPYIATYWRDAQDSIPQYRVIYNTSNGWRQLNTGFRKTAFSLGGQGTRSIPISRPQLVAWNEGGKINIALVFRDRERDNKASIAVYKEREAAKGWVIEDLTIQSIGAWEPTLDTELWKQKKVLSVFVQQVSQTNGEHITTQPGQMIQTIHWQP